MLSIDIMIEESTPLDLEGYVVHWASDEDAAAVVTFFERELGEMVGGSIRISLEGNTVFTRSDSRGLPFLISVMIMLALTLIGISLVPNLMLEEKATKTINTLLVSPASELQLVVGKALSGAFYCLLALAIAFSFNTALITHWWLAIGAGICGAFFAVSTGLLLGSVIEDRRQLTLWGWLVLIPLIMPVFLSLLTDLLPESVISAFRWIPTVALAKVFRVSFILRCLD